MESKNVLEKEWGLHNVIFITLKKIKYRTLIEERIRGGGRERCWEQLIKPYIIDNGTGLFM